jgi:hypothetical protein
VIEADRVELLGAEPLPISVAIDDGRVKIVDRCPSCQVAVFGRPAHPGLRMVRAGTLDDATNIVPDAHIFTRSKLPWIMLDEGVPAFETTYDREDVWPTSSLKRLSALDSPTD